MTQKVIKVGTSIAVTIPRHIARELKLRVGEHVEARMDKHAGSFSYHKASKAAVDKEVTDWTERFVERYKPALKALAKK